MVGPISSPFVLARAMYPGHRALASDVEGNSLYAVGQFLHNDSHSIILAHLYYSWGHYLKIEFLKLLPSSCSHCLVYAVACCVQTWYNQVDNELEIASLLRVSTNET